MAVNRPGPPLFTVMPAAALKRALRQSLPADTQVEWGPLGVLDVTAGKIGVVDAASLHPRYPSEIKVLDWPHGQAEVWVQRASSPAASEVRIFAVFLMAPGQRPAPAGGNWEVIEGGSMAIDSATAAFGDHARIMKEMRAGGIRSQTCLGRGSARDPAAKQSREQAAEYLRQQGFPVGIERFHTGSLSVGFSPGLTDEQVARANEMLSQAGSPEQVWVAGSHTSGLLADALMQVPVTQLNDDRGPYLFACRTGFGDGIYYWDGLWQNGQLCGYLCNFLPGDDGEGEGERDKDARGSEQVLSAVLLDEAVTPIEEPADAELIDAELVDAEIVDAEALDGGTADAAIVEPEAVARETSRAALAPATVPGVIVAVRQPAGTYWIARIERSVAGGWEVLYVTGVRATVPAQHVIPLPAHPVFQAGDEVLALWDQGQMDRGTITAVGPRGYTVAWTDGSPPQLVALGTLTFWSWTIS